MPGDFEYSQKYTDAITNAGGTAGVSPPDLKETIKELGTLIGTTNPSRVSAPVSGSLSVSFTATSGSLNTFLTTGSLAIGTWLVNLSAVVLTSGGLNLQIQANTGTATATLTGSTASQNDSSVTGTLITGASLCFVAVVTVAGTLTFGAYASGANQQVIAATSTNAYPNATGYTAIRIA
jgi:hypothetical protein